MENRPAIAVALRKLNGWGVEFGIAEVLRNLCFTNQRGVCNEVYGFTLTVHGSSRGGTVAACRKASPSPGAYWPARRPACTAATESAEAGYRRANTASAAVRCEHQRGRASGHARRGGHDAAR